MAKGSIRILALKNSPTEYEAYARVTGLKATRRRFATREAAQQFLDAVMPQMKDEAAELPLAKMKAAARQGGEALYFRTKLADALTQYKESVKFKRGTSCRGINTVLKNVGSIAIGKSTKGWVSDYVDKMRNTMRAGKPYAYSTLLGHICLMKAACTWWAEQMEVDEPKLHFTTKCFPEGWEVQRDRRLEPGEYDKIMEQIRQGPERLHWECLVQLALETGARLQELVRSEWRELARDDRLWIIPKGHTKKRKERRVPLSLRAQETIRLLRAEIDPGSHRIFHALGNPRQVSLQFRYKIKATGIVGLTFHDLRHEAISLMSMNKRKAPIKAIMDIVGHKTYKAFNRYSHFRDDELIGLLD
ncbi:hypothetical protein CR152_15660 [Massilia violaceinigra]|uniref:Tyr recombinase domain-containing protein n=1 Tax=Massilia violaceinigra TaxID=2045208 RepID=A0A2D2DLF1_9BURK|nr:site-specific integrase [Massilia violaceinigra]ATQ75803.1 hypothetical protein CR152_15660 [Massilia violaceinigra]